MHSPTTRLSYPCMMLPENISLLYVVLDYICAEIAVTNNPLWLLDCSANRTVLGFVKPRAKHSLTFPARGNDSTQERLN